MLPKTRVLKFFSRIGNTTLTRVPSHWLWLESSHSVKNVTRVDLSHHFSQRDSSRLELSKLWHESSHWVESRYHWYKLRRVFRQPQKSAFLWIFTRYLRLPLSLPDAVKWVLIVYRCLFGLENQFKRNLEWGTTFVWMKFYVMKQ